MATKIRNRTNSKQIIRFRRKKKIRATLSGNAARPRLSIFRSNSHLYVQLIDDDSGHTLAAVSTLESDMKDHSGKNMGCAKAVGQLIAKRALAKNIQKVVFDRSGYVYHGRIKAIADSAREAGLKF